ncbi:MAG: cytochrome c [Steroidobacteraceae bacterium]
MKRTAWLSLVCIGAGLNLGLAAEAPVSTTVVENAFRGALQDRSSSSDDEALFVEKCSMCHRQLGMGTVSLARRVPPDRAMLEKRTDLTADYVKVVARHGLVNMPRISRGEVSDAQLDRIARYLARGR